MAERKKQAMVPVGSPPVEIPAGSPLLSIRGALVMAKRKKVQAMILSVVLR